ncbi:hypothetical protein NHX12_020289 [Muraenolepis orangiensis]|uniref:Glycosyltransferase 8 domain-containing protein 2 n=1 Tax=Muraenolepis orangiensis TaxID=630683 RepID=A0A9Q0IVN7_9TELE|nr:hypothetical protein NHX12_020289 [Muraenolepis orangiensis]
MALLRKVNRVLLTLLVVMACVLLHSKLTRAPPPPLQLTEHGDRSTKSLIPVVICASENRMGAAMATINSVHSNTEASLIFYIVTLQDAVALTRQYIESTALKGIQYKILEFNPMVLRGKVKPDSSRPDLLHPLNFVRFYLPLLDINYDRLIYLDDDVIVQGDIKDLFSIRLQPGHAAAFASDCDLPSTHEMVRSVGMQTTYMGFLDYRKRIVKDLGINPRDCTFNPGVFVADMQEWKKQKITKQLERWMEENFRQNLYSSAIAGGVATPPMLIVFHNKFTTIDPWWNVRHLGWSPDSGYPDNVLDKAKLLHWNGRYKPWMYPSVHPEVWERWFVPDPTGKFSLLRPGSNG